MKMDVKMEDVGEKVPESAQEAPSAPLEPPSIPELNDWIGNLMSCKQLSEGDVQRLCDKVCSILRDGVSSMHSTGSGLNNISGEGDIVRRVKCATSGRLSSMRAFNARDSSRPRNAQSQCAVTYTGNSMISWSCLKLAGQIQTPITFSWVRKHVQPWDARGN